MLVKKNSIFRNIPENKLAEYKGKGYTPVAATEKNTPKTSNKKEVNKKAGG